MIIVFKVTKAKMNKTRSGNPDRLIKWMAIKKSTDKLCKRQRQSRNKKKLNGNFP
jgi:hypothetical protein